MRIISWHALGLASLISLSAAQSREFEVVKDQRWPNKVLARTLIVPRSSFDRAFLERLFSQALETEARTYPIIKIEVFAAREAASENFKFGTDIEYVSWRTLFNRYKERIPTSAQFISINGDAAMKVRDESGNVYSSVVSGKDPNILTIQGMRFHLADFIPRTIKIGRESVPDLMIGFYYWSHDHYDESIVMAAVEERIATTGVQRVRVVVEPSPWFILNDEFPLLYAYHSLSKPPTTEEYYSAYKVSCSSTFGPPLGCSSFGKKPQR